MKNKSLRIPSIILAVGLVMAIVASLLTGIIKAPVITDHDFPFTVTYRLDGESKALEGVYRCHFRSTGKGTDPLNRYYEGEHLLNPEEEHPAAYTIAQKDELELCIVTIFSDRKLMGDADGKAVHYDPYLAVMDSEGIETATKRPSASLTLISLTGSIPSPLIILSCSWVSPASTMTVCLQCLLSVF